MGRNFVNDDPNFDPLADEFDQVETGKERNHKKNTEFASLLSDEKAKTFAPLRTGDSVEAKIVSVGESAVFVDIGQRSEGVIGLEEFTPEELAALKPGAMLRLHVATTGAGGGGIELTKSLSARQASMDSVNAAMESGLPIQGKVTGENKGGFVIDLPGMKGFVPFSQMDVGARVPPAEHIGKTYAFKIVRLQGRDVVLSRAAVIRQEQEGEREKLLADLAVDQIVSAKVVGIETFGIFVDLGGGLTALVPQSEAAWSRGVSLKDIAKIGDNVTCKIIRIERTGNQGKPRIAASMKQVEGDPWDSLVDKLQVHQTMEGTVTRLMKFGAFVEVLPGIEGLVHISEMSAKRRISQPGEIVKPGDKVQTQITSIDRIAKRISLSMKALQDDVLDQETRTKYLRDAEKDSEHRGVEYRDSENQAAGIVKGTALGDAFFKAQTGKSKGQG